MKIIILQDQLRSGGTERHSILLAREFGALGHPSTLTTFRPGGSLASTVAGGLEVLQPFDTGIDWFGPGLGRRVLGGAPEIVLCMGKTANCFAGGLQRRAKARGLRTKVVATLRAGGRLPWFYYSSVRQASHLVTNSREAADELVGAHRFDRRRVSAIHNSLVFPERAQQSDEGMRARLGAGSSSVVLLSVAMFRPEKNQRELLEIAAGLQGVDWRLWFIGEGPERAACERLAARLGLSQRVRFLGYVSDPAPYYRAADVAVHASREEALSNFAIESQAHGLPVVACRALGMRECLIEGRTGWLVGHGDRSRFRDALVRLAAAPPSERAALAEEARTFARTAFDPGRQVAAYLSLFDSLLRDSAPGA